jgi:hypothetical protein
MKTVKTAIRVLGMIRRSFSYFNKYTVLQLGKISATRLQSIPTGCHDHTCISSWLLHIKLVWNIVCKLGDFI